MIEINNITKRFFLHKSLKEALFFPFKKNREILAVDNVSLRLERGQILALLGPNGAGKTTLIKILCTLILPDAGTAKIAGHDLITQSQEIRAKIGLVFGEEKGFYWRLTGRQNLEFFGILYNLSAAQIKERAARLSKLLDIDDLDKPFQNYSTGMKNRLALVRCLLSEPEIIFMDEPTLSLDPGSAHKFRNLIKENLVKELGKTVFFTTHQTKEAEDLADIIAVMDKGKVKAFGKPDEIKIKWGLNKECGLEELYLKVIAQENES